MDGSQVHRFTGSQVHRFTGSQVHRFAGSQVRRFAGSQVRRFAGPQVTGSRVRRRLIVDRSFCSSNFSRLHFLVSRFPFTISRFPIPIFCLPFPDSPFHRNRLPPISYLPSTVPLDILLLRRYSAPSVLLGGRPMVGLRTLDPPIGVRIPASQPNFQPPASTGGVFFQHLGIFFGEIRASSFSL